MRILFTGAGGDRAEIALCRHLAEQPDIDLHLICEAPSGLHRALEDTGTPITTLSFRSRIDPAAIRAVRNRLHQEPFDIIHAVTNRALANSLLASRGTSVRHIAYRGTIGHLSRFDPASRLTYLNRRVDRIVCVSDAVRAYLLSMGIPESRLVTIYKGHDPNWYEADTPPPLAEFGIPEDAFTVCFVGNMRPVKGAEVLLDAAERLPAPHNIHILMVGEVRDRRVQRRIDSGRLPGFVHFIGFREDASALTGACDAFVMPSVAREGLPRAVLEAMIQGVPAIVSDVGGMPELVIDGESGIVVPPRDAGRLAEAITTLRSDTDRRDRLGTAAKQRIRTHFNIRDTIERTIAL